MTITVWTLPLPSTNMVGEPKLISLQHKRFQLSFSLAEESGNTCKYAIEFTKVEAYKCTYLTSCSVEMITTSYDKLVMCSDTQWMSEVKAIAERVSGLEKNLKHYRIFFDDGPCYEFLCENISVCQIQK